jgi:hypothetical protein
VVFILAAFLSSVRRNKRLAAAERAEALAPATK